MFGDKFSSLLRTLLISLAILGQANSIHASEKTIFLHFVTFIDPPYTFDKQEINKKGLVEIILNTLMKNIGIKYDIRILPAKRAEISARTTTNTCILPIEKSQEREVFFSWVSPVVISKHGFFSMPYNDYIALNALSDARPYRIGSYLGSGIGEYLDSFEYKVDFAAQNEANIQKLNVNRIDLWASDILSAQHISKHTGIEITRSKLDFFTTLRAIGCHLDIDNEIIQKMRNQLQAMYRDGTMYAIIQKFKADSFHDDR
tara:strand:- start:44246 stop:45022 length:777 start_codon:yes stop_codon:yes gene_type:complete